MLKIPIQKEVVKGWGLAKDRCLNVWVDFGGRVVVVVLVDHGVPLPMEVGLELDDL